MLSLFVAVIITSLNANATPTPQDFADRIKQAAREALAQNPGFYSLQSVIDEHPGRTSWAVFYPNQNASAQLAIFERLHINDCVRLMQLKREGLENFIYNSAIDDIDSNFSGGLPDRIKEIGRVHVLMINRADTAAEFGAVAVQVAKARALFLSVLRKPVTKWVDATEADRGPGREQAAGIVAAGAALGSPPMIAAGLVSHILGGPVHKTVPDPVQSLAIEQAVRDAIEGMQMQLVHAQAKLKINPLQRAWVKLSARCQLLLIR